MNAAGVLLVIAGTWVLAQVTAGHALQRMGLTPADEDSGGVLKDPAGLLPGLAPYVPGGDRNPPFIDFGRLFPSLGR